jgi:hypothetical protein
MLATVVIPTYNRRDRIRLTLDAALADQGTGEVIVVVDGCHDGTQELLGGLANEDDRIRPLFVENGGAAVARQVGVGYARHDVVVFLDDDVIAGPDLITRHLAHHRDGSRRVVLGYMGLSLPDPRGPKDFPIFMYQRSYAAHVECWEGDPSRILDHFWAGNFSISRSDAMAVGMHNPRFAVDYHADYDFGLRAKAAGMRALFDRTLVADHAFTRTVAGFREAARAAGRDRANMNTTAQALRELGGTLRTSGVIELTANRAIAASTAQALIATITALGVARRFAAQERVAYLLQLVEQGRGAREAEPGDRALPDVPELNPTATRSRGR